MPISKVEVPDEEYERAEYYKELEADAKLQHILDQPRPGEPGYKD